MGGAGPSSWLGWTETGQTRPANGYTQRPQYIEKTSQDRGSRWRCDGSFMLLRHHTKGYKGSRTGLKRAAAQTARTVEKRGGAKGSDSVTQLWRTGQNVCGGSMPRAALRREGWMAGRASRRQFSQPVAGAYLFFDRLPTSQTGPARSKPTSHMNSPSQPAAGVGCGASRRTRR